MLQLDHQFSLGNLTEGIANRLVVINSTLLPAIETVVVSTVA